MNKVTTVNLNGRAYQVEEQAFEALRAYLDEAERLLSDDPDCREILADLEQAIGDKGARYLGAGKDVLSEADMKRILAEMGPVETDAETAGAAPLSGAAQAASAQRETTGPKRLYLIREGEMIAGVCNGLAAYFGVDPTIVRLIFVLLLVFTSGLFGIAYLVLMFVVPTAKTAEERAAARGLPFNAQELVEEAKRHYADMKESHQRWRDRRRQKQERAFWRPREKYAAEEAQVRPLERPQPGYGTRVAAGIVLPLISAVSAALVVACIFTLFSYLSTGSVLGWSPPFAVPPWAAICAMIVAYALIAAPLRAVRYASYEALGPRRGWFVFWDGVLWLALVILAAWIAVHELPGLSEFLRHPLDDWRGFPHDFARAVASSLGR